MKIQAILCSRFAFSITSLSVTNTLNTKRYLPTFGKQKFYAKFYQILVAFFGVCSIRCTYLSYRQLQINYLIFIEVRI